MMESPGPSQARILGSPVMPAPDTAIDQDVFSHLRFEMTSLFGQKVLGCKLTEIRRKGKHCQANNQSGKYD